MATRPEREGGPGLALAPRAREQPARARPRKFKVLLHDDDFTTMEFVVGVLREVFGHGLQAATRLMLDVHEKGVGMAGVYPHEVAEAKADKVIELARREEFPFLATLEPADSDGEAGQ